MGNTSISDTWERGSSYEQYVGRWSRRVAPVFLSWLNLPIGGRWVDVGCGTGALCAAIVDHASPSKVVGIEPSEGFLKLASQALGTRAELQKGSAAQLPLGNATCDAVVSGLVLNFVPDLPGALAEMARVAAPRGTIAAYVWDYAGKMELIRLFWDAAVELDPEAAKLHEGTRFPLCSQTALRAAFESAGLREIDVLAIDVKADFGSYEDYWAPFLGGQGPAPAYAMSLSEANRSRLREKLRSKLKSGSGGAISLTARAWAIRATNQSDADLLGNQKTQQRLTFLTGIPKIWENLPK